MLYEQGQSDQRSVAVSVLRDSFMFGDELDRLIQSSLDYGYVRPSIYDDRNKSIAIGLTEDGIREATLLIRDGHSVEKKLGPRDADWSYSKARVPPDGAQFLVDIGVDSPQSSFRWMDVEPPLDDERHPELKVNSASWTGLQTEGTLSGEALVRLRMALSVVDDAVEKSNISNQEKSQARAYVLAIHALADAPDPPADLIWQIVQRVAALAGVAALFVALIDLYK
ncbi:MULTISPECIES: hypothetical protein [unclassified Novosphingobium]|uniref:hypothetical protein n=1 Tax=unclassified Novosphingobium TaxID=2644732 RepID=UPI0025D14744|nr:MULTISPECIES: hypothetical protein [unclassified Novosphingobium]HQV02846.1 hypothetical protein [Novosphingobium sp.]